MTFDIKSLETSIKTTLQTISNFKIVYDYYTLESEGFPYASFEMGNFDGEFADSCSNHRIITFNCVIVQVMNDDISREDAKSIIYDILNEMINTFDGSKDLGNSEIVNNQVIKGEMGTFLSPQGDTLALSVQINLEVNNFIN